MLETLQAFKRKGDMYLFVCDRHNRAQHNVIAANCESDNLPSTPKFLRQLFKGKIFDQNAEQPLIETVRQMEFFEAPTRREPCLRHEEQHRLATICRLVQRALPALPCRNASIRIKVEKDLVFPAVSCEPVA